MRSRALPTRLALGLLPALAAAAAVAPRPAAALGVGGVAAGAEVLRRRDGATGLADRAGLVRELRRRRRCRTRYGLVAVELGPAAALDHLGRDADAVARAVARRLRRHDAVACTARTGPGRFVLVVPRATRVVRAVGRWAAAEVATEPRVVAAGLRVVVAATAEEGPPPGACPLPAGTSGLAALAAVEAELERARQRPDGWSMRGHAAADDDAVLAARLRRALDDGTFTAAFQPVVDLRDGSVVAVEALARWMDPDLGIVSPARFVGVAERSDLVLDLTDRMLGLARRCQERLRLAGFDLEAAVNVSARFLDDRLVDLVQAHGGHGLVLEVTETGLMDDAGAAARSLGRLVAAGARVAIDDFGVGRSSLGYLVDLPVSTLKIDRSFVDRMAEGPAFEAVVRSTVDLGRRLGVEVVAEGVERPDQLDRLRALGCDRIQGYLVAPPLSEGALLALLQEHRRASATVVGGAVSEVRVGRIAG